MAMDIQFTEEDLPQGSSIDMCKCKDNDNVQTKAKAAPGPRVDSSSRPTPTAKANLTSTSTTRVEPVLTADSDTTAAIIANGIKDKGAEAFKADLAKAQGQDWQEEAASKA